MARLNNKKIVLGITGGIAAYKSASLLRLLRNEGAEVQVIMTENARHFIGMDTLAALSGGGVLSDFTDTQTGQWNNHVQLEANPICCSSRHLPPIPWPNWLTGFATTCFPLYIYPHAAP